MVRKQQMQQKDVKSRQFSEGNSVSEFKVAHQVDVKKAAVIVRD